MTIVALRTPEPLNYRAALEKYPDVSPFVILKTDIQRRGVKYTAAAFAELDPSRHLTQARAIFASIGEKQTQLIPASLLLRDGSSVIVGIRPDDPNAYVVDVIDGKLVVTDGGEVLEEVEYWPRPDYVTKVTSSGRPMWQVLTPRPQRLDVNPYSYCHFWDDGHGCRYCNIGSNYNRERKANDKPLKLDPRDVSETLAEALKQKGRFANIMLTGGSILSGAVPFDDEVQVYIDMLQAIGENFATRRFPSQLIATAFSLEQLARIHENTGLLTYTADIEVLNEDKFNWICPGKALKVGYREWKKRLVEAVGIFGRGHVNTGLVGGVELARPDGFASEDDALDATLSEADDLASHGVATVQIVWGPAPGSQFSKQHAPSLDFFIRLSVGLDEIRRRHGLNADMDNYRLCGNHPDSDLSRVWAPKELT